MKITCVSDLHGDMPKLDGGDVLIIAGDWTAHDSYVEHRTFAGWLIRQDYRKKIIIAGNHDKLIQKNVRQGASIDMPGMDAVYLCDSGVEFEGIKFWGSPWTKWFEGVNPDCDAFMLKTEFQLMEKFSQIPSDTDILITHSPPFMVLDYTVYAEHVGSTALADVTKNLNLKYHIFGHIHEDYGQENIGKSIAMNVSRMNRSYRPVNAPVIIEV